ncbi:MAG: alternative ribosome rescue aminoacyl-tRNA hydrolase ArfB [Rubripirellula sp.]
MEPLRVTSQLVLCEKEIQITTARSSGPGGQNVNKLNTKATLRWSPSQCAQLPSAWKRRFITDYHNRITRDGIIVLQSERYRDQKKNIKDVRQRLVQMLLSCQHPPKKRTPTRPTKGSQRRRLQSKREQSEKKARRQGRPTMD